jgi:hypothetical protein
MKHADETKAASGQGAIDPLDAERYQGSYHYASIQAPG